MLSSAPFWRALERQQIGQFLDLPIEPHERLVLARNLAREEELRQHEHRQQENDHQQHRRQGVDEARPIVHRAHIGVRATAPWIQLPNLAAL